MPLDLAELKSEGFIEVDSLGNIPIATPLIFTRVGFRLFFRGLNAAEFGPIQDEPGIDRPAASRISVEIKSLALAIAGLADSILRPGKSTSP